MAAMPRPRRRCCSRLEWLKKQQARDGGWSLVGPYPDGAIVENRCAATAMALLAFQGYGATHKPGVDDSRFSRCGRARLEFPPQDAGQGRLFSVTKEATISRTVCPGPGDDRDL